LIDFFTGIGHRGSPIAASMTDRARRFGSVGFLDSFFFLAFGFDIGA
jgi:hypothetical protein